MKTHWRGTILNFLYVCVLAALDAIYEKREPDARGIRQNVTDKKIVATVLQLCDILKPVNLLSLYLQEEDVNFTTLPERVKVTIDSLTSLVAIYRQYAGIPLVYDLVQEIEDAFNHGDPVLDAFGLFNPQNLSENVCDLSEYGNASIEKLVEHQRLILLMASSPMCQH